MDRVTNLLREIASHPDQAYRHVIAVALIAGVVVIVVHLLVVLIRRPASTPGRPPWNLWERFVYFLTIVSVGVLGVTAFYPVLLRGAMEGWYLLVHLMASGLLVLMLPLLALTWAHANRFGQSHAASSRNQPSRGAEWTAAASRFFWLTKVTFWILLASALVSIATMLGSMYPIAGTEDMHQLLDVHRYSGLLAVVAAMLHLYAVCLQRHGLR